MTAMILGREVWKNRKTVVKTKAGYYVLVTTVYTGHTTLYGYETMVFPWNPRTEKVDDYDELEIDTYDYPDVADVGHEQMVDKWRDMEE